MSRQNVDPSLLSVFWIPPVIQSNNPAQYEQLPAVLSFTEIQIVYTNDLY